ncbi:MAG: Ig-like domain-containing protein [Kofleriaceae bacterium]
MLTRLGVAMVSITGLIGCAESPDLGSSAGQTFEEFRAEAQAHRDPAGFYVLDGDIPVYGDDGLYDYWQRTQHGALSVYTENGADVVWDATQKKNLTYCVGSSFGANKAAVVAALAEAADNGWHKAADVKFIHLADQDGAGCNAQNQNVVFDVNYNPIPSSNYAVAFWPNMPRSQRTLRVWPRTFMSPVSLTNMLGHELGHILGLRHEHIRAPMQICPEGLPDGYRALTEYDSASIMHYPWCGGSSTTMAFTESDFAGIAALYGPAVVNAPPTVEVLAPAHGATVGPTFTVKATAADMDLIAVDLMIDGAIAQSVTAEPFEFEVKGAVLGPHVITIVATDSIGQTADKSVKIYVDEPDGKADGDQDDRDAANGGCHAGASLSGLSLLLPLVLRRRRRVR